MLLIEIHIYVLVIIINEASDRTVNKPVIFVTPQKTANLSTEHVFGNIKNMLIEGSFILDVI